MATRSLCILPDEPATFVYPDEGKAYVRRGECTRCGACCPGCEYLRREIDGKGTCVGRFTAYYHNGCNVWPSHPNQTVDKPECGYWFEVVEPCR